MLVALKVIRSGMPEREIASHVRLNHPNIVKVFDGAGLRHDPPYFAMQLVEGGTLADEKWQAHFSEQAKAVELLITIADTVQYAHERLVMHRDLKPENVLMEESGRPLVGDFGVAKGVSDEEPALTSTVVGSLAFMSPEQAGATQEAVTTASDVYALGAILYQLLTGRLPRRAENLDELIESFRNQQPIAPRRHRPSISPDLDAVCMKALAADTKLRYPTAAALAQDLRMLQAGEAPRWLAGGVAKRAGRWFFRHPWAFVTVGGGAVLLALANVAELRRSRSQEAELQQVVLKTNGVLAKAQAQATLAVFEKHAASLLQAAARLPLEHYLQRPVRSDPPPDAELAVPGFDRAFVVGCDGFVRAHSFDASVRVNAPRAPPGYHQTNFAFRDYFRGAQLLAERGFRQVYLSRAFQSRWGQHFSFAFTTPIYVSGDKSLSCPPGSEWAGVFAGAKSVSSTLGEVQIADLGGSGHQTALFGPRDRESATDPRPPETDFHVIAHDKLPIGDLRSIDPSLARRLAQRFGRAVDAGAQFSDARAIPYEDRDYTDTLDDPRGRWLGGFYPVGNTGYVIAVQTAYGTATKALHPGDNLRYFNVAFLMYSVVAVAASLRRRKVA